AAAAVAAGAEQRGGEFPGSEVVEEVARRGSAQRIPNLRILVSYGLLEKSGATTHSGRRAWYRMPDRNAVEEALDAWRHRNEATPKRFSFIASGRSTEPPTDTARRAGEIVFEPGPWR